jgi:hypothetical protein
MAKLLRRLASCANLIVLRPIEKPNQVILRPAPHKYAINWSNITVVLVAELWVAVHADRVPISEQYLADRILNLSCSLFSRFLHARAMQPSEKGQRREPAADGVGFVSERIGWLPLAGPDWFGVTCHVL